MASLRSLGVCLWVGVSAASLFACSSDAEGDGTLPVGGAPNSGGAGGSDGMGGSAALGGSTASGGSGDPIIVDGDGGSGGAAGAGGSGGGNCDPNFTGIVRDFQADHPDFESFSGDGISPGIVADTLGEDQKPVYNETGPYMEDVNGELAYVHPEYRQQTTSKARFDEWYRDVEGTNIPVEYPLMLESEDGKLVFATDNFFPIDGQGFGDEALGIDGELHNFSFTFELHTEFSYEGGEVFTFTGDDDLWVFINGKLAVDVGGLHPKMSQTIELDAAAAELGIERGQTYPLDLFHAERHTDASRFRVETSIKFTNCDPIFVDPPR